MTSSSAQSDAMTFVPNEAEAATISKLLVALHPEDSTGSRPALVDRDDIRIELPEPVFDMLLNVTRAMAAGEAISVIPRSKMLTTQEAADMLGISRPTLVRLLENGEISFTKHGRHRRVQLSDLLDYQSRARKERSDALDHMVELGESSDLYSATDGPPRRTR